MRLWFENLAFDWVVRRRYPIRIARTAQEREAVYRLRYEIYLQEQGTHDHPELDEVRGWLHGPIDDDPATRIYYLGTPERVLGTVRVRVWGPGEVPEAVARLHSIDLLPGAGERTIGDIKMVMLRRDLRGAAAAPAMLVNAILEASRDRPVDLWFAFGAPGLVRHYARLGFDPHGGRFFLGPRGLQVSLLGLPGDLGALAGRGTPIRRALARVPQSGLSCAELRAVMDGERSVRTDLAALREVVEGAARTPGHVLSGLSAPALDVIARAAVLLELQDGERLIREGFIGKELYIVVDGRVVASRGGAVLGSREPGDVIGEVAFLGVSDYRTADCAVEGRTTVLALRHSLLRLLDPHPADRDRLRERLVAALSG